MKKLILFLIPSLVFSLELNMKSIQELVKSKDNSQLNLIRKKYQLNRNIADEVYLNYKFSLDIQGNGLWSSVSENIEQNTTKEANYNISLKKNQPMPFGANMYLSHTLYQDRTKIFQDSTYSLSQETILTYHQPLSYSGMVKNQYSLIVLPINKALIDIDEFKEINTYFLAVIYDYYQLLKLKRALVVLDLNITNMKTFENISKNKFSDGLISKIDYEKIIIEMNKLELSKKNLVMNLQNNINLFFYNL